MQQTGLSTATLAIKKIQHNISFDAEDLLPVEEPLQVKIEYGAARNKKDISVTMRTPGDDEELSTGFLFTEGIIRSADEIENCYYDDSNGNSMVVRLQEHAIPNLPNTDRNFYSNSGCGVCGKPDIESIRTTSIYTIPHNTVVIDHDVFYRLNEQLRNRQLVFQATGGLHAAAFFTADGTLQLIKEDVGRHNALDKLIGAALNNRQLPLHNGILVLSGRAGFELIQKAVMAGISVIAAVGAPSSLAVELAMEHNITLIGFLRNERFNIYCGDQRIVIK